MISIKTYLESNSEGLPTLLRVLHVLLQGISKHIIDYDPGHTARFRRSIEEIATSFDESQSKSEMLFLAGAAVKALDDYNQHATAHFDRRQGEFGGLIKMLSETVRSISSTGTENVTRLQEIEKLVNSVREASDIAVIKVRLGDCLDGIRKEVTRQRAETEKATQMLASEIQIRQGTPAGSLRMDGLTGLPPRDAAESAISARCASGKASYVGVLMVDHLQLYNVRFGRSAGDNILRHFAENVRQLLPKQDELFRWGGPTFIAMFDRASTIEDIRSEVRRLLEKVPQITLESDTRSAILSVTSRWTVFPTSPPAQTLVRKIDMFTSVHTSTAS